SVGAILGGKAQQDLLGLIELAATEEDLGGTPVLQVFPGGGGFLVKRREQRRFPVASFGFADQLLGLIDFAIGEMLPNFYGDLVQVRAAGMVLGLLVEAFELALAWKLAFGGLDEQQGVRPRLGVHLLLDHLQTARQLARTLL